MEWLMFHGKHQEMITNKYVCTIYNSVSYWPKWNHSFLLELKQDVLSLETDIHSSKE